MEREKLAQEGLDCEKQPSLQKVDEDDVSFTYIGSPDDGNNGGQIVKPEGPQLEAVQVEQVKWTKIWDSKWPRKDLAFRDQIVW